MKNVRVLDAAGEAVSYGLNPLPKQLGQKYGSRFPAIRKALLALDAGGRRENAAGWRTRWNVTVNGETYADSAGGSGSTRPGEKRLCGRQRRRLDWQRW